MEDSPLTIEEVMAIDYSQLQVTFQDQLIEEYQCSTPSEMSLVSVIALNYIQYLDLQKQLEAGHNRVAGLHYAHKSCRDDSFHPYDPTNACNVSKIELQRLAFLSKEMDRCFRRYGASLNMLRMMKQSPMHLTVNSKTAFIGNNQTVQVNNYEDSINAI